MNELVFLLEEPSAEELIKGLLSKFQPVLPEVNYIRFEGKSDLDKRLERKLRAYNNPDAYFIVMRDQDSGDCQIIKNDLSQKCKKTGKRALIRILCRELESWYLA